MDIRSKQFAKIIAVIGFSFFIIFLTLWSIYAYIPIYYYRHFLSAITIAFSILVLFFIVMSILLLIMYKNEKVFIFSPKFRMTIFRWIYPWIIYMADLLHYNKLPIHQFFIYMNNIFVDSIRLNGIAMDILILVPHCIQNSDCSIKITSDPMACTECGKCKISDLKHLREEYGCKIALATGGTVARRVVKESNPKYIIAIACERDLISGILDIKNIPVYGILNQCPNGPCFNTTVDMQKVKNAINKYVVSKE